MFATGAQLKQARKKANLTLDKLASLSGIDRGTISRIELGHVSPRIDTLGCLCSAMGLSLAEFFKTNGEEPPPVHKPQGPPQEPGEDNHYWPAPISVWQGLVGVVERFEAMLSRSGEMVSVMNHAGEILYVSPGGEHLLGYRRSELQGRRMIDLIHKEQQDKFLSAFEMMSGKITTEAFSLRGSQGQMVTFDCVLANHLRDPLINAIILNGVPRR
jgi:PAS domain S-box-containing protein